MASHLDRIFHSKLFILKLSEDPSNEVTLALLSYVQVNSAYKVFLDIEMAIKPYI